MCDRWRVHNVRNELAVVVAREHGNIHRSGELGAAALVRLIERCDAIRKPERFDDILLACECDARGRTGFENTAYPQRQRLQAALDAALAVDTAPVAQAAAQRGLKGKAIGDAVAQAREQAIAAHLGT